MAALETVADYLAEARVILQDKVSPYRYSDDEIVAGLNYCILEISRIRPDIFHEQKYLAQVNRSYKANRLTVPFYSSAAPTTAVELPIQIRIAVLLFITGYAQLRDAEDVQDQRAGLFISNFVQKLLAVAA